jgi:exosortase
MHQNPAAKKWDGTRVTTHTSFQPRQLIAGDNSQQHFGAIVQLIAAVVAFWPIWFWYCERISDRSDEPLGVVALITVIALAWARRSGVREPDPDSARNWLARLMTGMPFFLVILYSCLLHRAPLVVQSVIAVSAIGILLMRVGATRFLLAGDWALLLLSLPVVASLNFYFGYPLRLLASYLASVLLNLGGLAVRVQGAAIFWNNTDVSIDQPCSGIRMLWVALYLSATLSSMFRLRLRSAMLVLFWSVVSAVVANALRVSSLFYLESGIIKIEAPWHSIVHSGIGVAAFALTAVIITKLAFVISCCESAESASLTGTSKAAHGRMQCVPARTSLPGACEEGHGRMQWTQAATRLRGRAQVVALLLCCGVAAALPFFVGRVQESVDLRTFKGWPTRFEGRALHEQKLSSATAAFANRFPGCIAVFTDDKRRIIFRWVTQPTRQLHSAETCYKASGYEIRSLPQYQDSEGHDWAACEATKDSEKLRIRERIFDDAGHGWTDVSAWYWSAVLQHSRAPWWSICVVERLDTDDHLLQSD